MPTRRHFLLASAGVAVFLAGCDKLAQKNKTPFAGIDITGAPYGKTLNLTDHTGKPRTLQDFQGKVVALFFGFTQCPDICPTTMSEMAQVKRDLGLDGALLQVLFVTVDPKRDTPELLAQYVPAFDKSFLGLYGNTDATAAAAKEFRIYYREVPGKTPQSYTVDHSSQMYLLDRQGRLRILHMHGAAREKVLADVRALLVS